MSKFTKKLGDDKTYARPKVTHTEKLSGDEIAEKLEGYEKVDNIAEVGINTHLRYFTTTNGEQLFRMGGFLHNKNNADTYVVLTNGKNTWSVQVKGTIFFKKLSHDEETKRIHALYKKKLTDKEAYINALIKYINANVKNPNIPSPKSITTNSESKPTAKSDNKAVKVTRGSKTARVTTGSKTARVSTGSKTAKAIGGSKTARNSSKTKK